MYLRYFLFYWFCYILEILYIFLYVTICYMYTLDENHIVKEMTIFLQDPKNKQFAICDEELMKVIGVKRFRTFGMMKYLKNHFVD